MLRTTLVLQFKSLSLVNPFLHGATARSPIFPPNTSVASAVPCFSSGCLVIKAMRSLQGKVVWATNDKMVAVEVVRLAPHPKYKRHVRKKKKYQVHDPLNQFNVGDFVQLEKCSPISKSKTFWAVAAAARNPKAEVAVKTLQDLGIRLELEN